MRGLTVVCWIAGAAVVTIAAGCDGKEDQAQTPEGGGTVYLPSITRVLPGTLYIHDVVMVGNELYVTVTGHNFVARIDVEAGWERVWWPRVLDHLSTEGFRSNWLQLNSI